MDALKKHVLFVWEFALDTIAPQDPEIRRIEGLRPDALVRETLIAAAYGPAEHRSKRAREAVYACVPYRVPVMKTALVEIKERKNKKIANLLGAVLCDFLYRMPDTIIGANSANKNTRPLIVPVPITNRKRRMRGWNQCDLIAQGVRRTDERSAHCYEVRTDILKKIRETDDQVGKSRIERFDSQRGVFAVPDELASVVRGRTIIVFDDIVTTGATLSDAARALSQAGAARVIQAAVGY
jgi:ComF family protein